MVDGFGRAVAKPVPYGSKCLSTFGNSLLKGTVAEAHTPGPTRRTTSAGVSLESLGSEGRSFGSCIRTHVLGWPLGKACLFTKAMRI